MSKFLTFPKGGVHPKDKKYLSKDKSIEKVEIPNTLTISFSQHLGSPSNPIKSIGDNVVKGELIAEASSFISGNIHSPVNGKIKKIEKVVSATGSISDAYVIEVNQEAEEPEFTRQDVSKFSPNEIRQAIKDMGIVGLGGASFPSNVKVSIPTGKTCEYLIVNAVECEPYITSDYRVSKERFKEIFLGLDVLKRATDAKSVHIGVEANKMDVVKLFKNYAADNNIDVQVHSLKMKYPQGDEKQLIKAITKREVPSGKLPIDVGAVVSNVSSVYAVYEALYLKKPLFERVVTVSGEMINNPRNMILPIGTSIKHIIELCGGLKSGANKIVVGGPMMGFSQCSIDTCITKNIGSILALEVEKRKEMPCVRCGMCVDACPMGLSPTTLYRLYESNQSDLAVLSYNAMDCKECGCCSYSCPSHINLVQGMRMNKKLGRKR